MKVPSKAKEEDATSPMPSVAAESPTFKAASGEGESASPFLKARNSEQKSNLDINITKSKFSTDLKGIPEKSDLGK